MELLPPPLCPQGVEKVRRRRRRQRLGFREAAGEGDAFVVVGGGNEGTWRIFKRRGRAPDTDGTNCYLTRVVLLALPDK